MHNSLSVQNINFSYSTKHILKNITFACTNGITSILGPNGAGKTTLMKILIGKNKPSSGEIILNNEDFTCFPEKSSVVGYLPQNFDIYNNVTGYDFLSFVCDIKKITSKQKKRYIEESIEQFNLEKVIYKNIGRYSGGFKRRLGIAQAVIGNPNLVIIDEPTVGLDPEQRLEFRHYLSEISKERIVLISTHILEDVELYTKNILILNQGSIIFDGDESKAIEKAKNNIYTMNININDLSSLKSNIVIIEEKKLSDTMLKIKFISNGAVVANSEPEKEVSLENAYVFFQNTQNNI